MGAMAGQWIPALHPPGGEFNAQHAVTSIIAFIQAAVFEG